MTWLLQDAKARFSEVVNLCLKEGPQTVTRHGRNTVVVVSFEEYRRLTTPTTSLGTFLRSAPRVDLEIARSREPGREVELE
jgi:prevent-host-death family protein